jgi:hypothetical protein
VVSYKVYGSDHVTESISNTITDLSTLLHSSPGPGLPETTFSSIICTQGPFSPCNQVRAIGPALEMHLYQMGAQPPFIEVRTEHDEAAVASLITLLVFPFEFMS